MRSDVNRDWHEFSDPYLPLVQEIVGPLLLTKAPPFCDLREATDLKTFTAQPTRLAVRIRRPGYVERYPFDFTIRYERASGEDTEMKKLVDGWGDLFFYGHAARGEEVKFERWFLISLRLWRAQLIRDHQQKSLVFGNMPNSNDHGATTLRWYDLRSFSPSITFKASIDIPQVRRAQLLALRGIESMASLNSPSGEHNPER